MAEKFQGLYEMEYNGYEVDVKGAHTDWRKMFQTVNYLNFLNQKRDLLVTNKYNVCYIFFKHHRKPVDAN